MQKSGDDDQSKRNGEEMKALQDVSDKLQITGLGCPECPGVLQVSRREGNHLIFRCRIGHVLSLQDLIVAKENRLDAVLWSSVECLEELAALCRDLAALDGLILVDTPTLKKRSELATAHAEAIRQIIERDEPTVMGTPESDEPTDESDQR